MAKKRVRVDVVTWVMTKYVVSDYAIIQSFCKRSAASIVYSGKLSFGKRQRQRITYAFRVSLFRKVDIICGQYITIVWDIRAKA